MNDFLMNGSFGDFDDIDDVPETPEEESSFSEADYDDGLLIDSYYTNETLNAMTSVEAKALEQQETLHTLPDTIVSENTENAVKDSDITYSSSETEEKKTEAQEQVNKAQELVVDSFSWIVEKTMEGIDVIERTSDKKQKVRTYKNVAVMPKITYAKAASGKSFLKTLIIFLIVCSVVGGIFSVYANSYMAVHYKENPTPMACAFSWIMEFDTLPINLSQTYPDVMGMGFLMGFGILGIIGLFVWLDSDAKKQSRVGHEHGAARLANDRDYKTFKNKFMEG